MTRQQKYPETQTFRLYNANPKNRLTGDCAYRAIALALNKPWETVVMEMAVLACENGYSPASKENIDRYMTKNGWIKKKQPRRFDNTKFTGEDWCKEITKGHLGYFGDVMLAKIGGHHIVCIKVVECDDGIHRAKVHDTWDSTDYCIGNYWVKANRFAR